jgi:hypothetical protein
MRKQTPRNRLLLIPVLLLTTLLLTACPAPTDVIVGEVVERETGEIVQDATITMTLLNDEGIEVGSKSCQNCQTLSERIDWPTRGDRVIIRVEASGYVPWEAESPSSQALPTASTGAGYRVELTPLTGLEAYRTELAAAMEKVENLLSEAQRRQFPQEAFEQSLIEALAGLHQTDENLAGLAAPTPTDSGD